MCVCVCVFMHACTVHVIMYVMHVCVCLCMHYFIRCFRSKKKRKKKLFPMVCSCTLMMHLLHTLLSLLLIPS